VCIPVQYFGFAALGAPGFLYSPDDLPPETICVHLIRNNGELVLVPPEILSSKSHRLKIVHAVSADFATFAGRG